MLRVLLLTSHPIQGRDGADKEIALGLLQHIDDVEFTWVSGVRSRELASVGGRRLRIVSAHGTPGLFERGQAALLGLMHERSVDLVHVVSTIGAGFRGYSKLRAALDRGTVPLVHTVPGVTLPRHVMDTRPIGTTVAVSQTTREMLEAAGFGSVRCIPNGISLERWSVAPVEPHVRPVLLFAGHNDVGGGAQEVLGAAGELQAQGTSVRLVLALRTRGGRKNREARFLLESARRLGLDDVAVHGRVADMPHLLAACDVLMFPPSQLVGGKADVPLVVLEAMASGRPVIVTDLPQFDALEDRVVRVPTAEPAALFTALYRLVADPEIRVRLGADGRALVEQRFSAALMARRYRELYDELLATAC